MDVVPGAQSCLHIWMSDYAMPSSQFNSAPPFRWAPPAGPVREWQLTTQDPAWPRIAARLPILSPLALLPSPPFPVPYMCPSPCNVFFISHRHCAYAASSIPPIISALSTRCNLGSSSSFLLSRSPYSPFVCEYVSVLSSLFQNK